MGRIFAIGDPHLSRGCPKPMDVFGEHWRDHGERIFAACRELVADDDLLILAGDISWALKLEQAVPDLADIGALPGQKLLLRGNHDFWWQSRAKVERVIDHSIRLLQNDSIVFGETAIAGGRGWTLPDDPHATDEDRKIFRRELERLKLSFASLKRKSYASLLAALHYPPLAADGEPTEVTDLLESAGVSTCIYGHLHGEGIAAAFNGTLNGITYRLVSADSVNFSPVEVVPVASEVKSQ